MRRTLVTLCSLLVGVILMLTILFASSASAIAVPPTIYGGAGNPDRSTQTTEFVEAYVEPNGLDTHYEVEYGPTTAYGSTTEPVDMGTETGYTTETLRGLTVNTTYHLRFVASNSQGTTYGQDATITTEPAAFVWFPRISEAGNTEVTLKSGAEVWGAPSTFYFEYGPTSEYGLSTKEEVLSGGASAIVTGLMPDTKYHFRVVVKNQYGTIRGEDYAFSTSPVPSLSLPDDRAYEKVSLTNNAKGNVIPPAPISAVSSEGAWTFQPFVAAADGNAVVYMADPSETGGTGHEGGGYGNQYFAKRTGETGWSAENIEPSTGIIANQPGYQAFTKNLEDGFLVYNGEESLTPGAPDETYNGLYRRDLSTMAFTPLFTGNPPNRTATEFRAFGIPTIPYEHSGPAYMGSSADLSHMFFMANDALTPGAIDGGRRQNNLYDSYNGELSLVNVLPGGETEPNAIIGGPVLPNDSPSENGPALTHAISEDGQRVYWTDLNNGNLYLRENEASTVQVDASVGGGGAFWTATPDGSKALFIKSGDIYEYDAASGQVSDLTPGGEVQGIVSTSEDLSYVYFVADAALAAGAEAQTCQPEEPQTSCNLYVVHQGEPPKFIAALSAKDNESAVESSNTSALVGDWQPGPGEKEAQATPNGRSLVFTSLRSLTGYNNEAEGRQTAQVFVYDYEGSKLSCASCNPTNEPPHHQFSAFLPVSYMNTYSHRWISADGTEVFFDSNDSLVPQDTNGLWDVYEWEQDGSGTCALSQGCIYLLSAGNSPESSFLADVSESGDDVFFTTRSQLVPEDKNENIDLYDARADGPRPQVAPQCSGTGCQGIPSAPPVFSTPSSVTYNGVGNFPPPTKSAVKAKKSKPKKPKQKKKSKKSKKKKGNASKKRKGASDRSRKSIRKSAKSQGRSK